MDSAHHHAFLTPTTYFTVACVAFSVLAFSAVWRNQHVTSSKINEEPPRPKPVRRRAVDSICVASNGRAQIDEETNSSASQRLAELIELIATVAQSLRSMEDLNMPTDPTSTTTALIGELSFFLTSLCRLQQQLSNAEYAEDVRRNGIVACLDSTLAGLQDTLRLLGVYCSRAEMRTNSALAFALQQLRDQRATLAFLLESTESVSVLPPTPPCEADVQVSLKEYPSTARSLLPPAPIAIRTGLTPSVDAKAWIEPPPEYSPPSASSNIVLPADKKQEPTTTPAPPPSTVDSSSTSSSDSSALIIAVSNNDISTLTHLLTHSLCEPNAGHGEHKRTALHHAAHLNASPAIPHLLRAGALLTAEDAAGDTPIHLAAWNGHVEALTALLTYCNTTSTSSSTANDTNPVNFLSGRDAYTPLFTATSNLHVPAARLLLLHGADPNITSPSNGGTRALHQAAITGSSALCSLLLSNGAEVDAIDEEGNTALHYAATSGSVGSVKALLRAGADLRAKQRQGLTAAHWAAHKGHAEVLTLLLQWSEVNMTGKKGAGVNVRAAEGATPLHLAANRGHLGCVKLLLEKGASRDRVGVWDGVEGTAGEMARVKGHLKIVRVIEKGMKS